MWTNSPEIRCLSIKDAYLLFHRIIKYIDSFDVQIKLMKLIAKLNFAMRLIDCKSHELSIQQFPKKTNFLKEHLLPHTKKIQYEKNK